MTTDISAKQKNAADAQQIYLAGWRQGTAFQPVDAIRPPFAFDQHNEVLIIATHSCSVVSQRFEVDPDVEAITARKLQTFEPRSPEASGKNQRKLHLKLLSASDCKAIECDLRRRFFFPRKILLDLTPIAELSIDPVHVKSLGNWIARSYIRNAFPEELVRRIKRSLFPHIEKILKRTFMGVPFISEVLNILIDWQPREEISGSLYILRFVFVCKNSESAASLRNQLSTELSDFIFPNTFEGLQIQELQSRSENRIPISKANPPFEKLTEWDYFTSLGDLAGFLFA